MSAAARLVRDLKAAGLSITLDGDDSIRVRPARAVTPARLAELRRHKPEIIALLRAGEDGLPWPELPVVVESAPERIHSGWATIIDDHRTEIRAALEPMRHLVDARMRALARRSRVFLESEQFAQAIEAGWSVPEMFGISAVDWYSRADLWGIVAELAFSPITIAIEEVTAKHVIFTTRSGGMLRLPRFCGVNEVLHPRGTLARPFWHVLEFVKGAKLS